MARLAAPHNHFLAALPPQEWRNVAPHLRRTMVSQGLLLAPDTRPRAVYFPDGAVLSLIGTTTGGSSLQMATVGLEGLVGAGLFSLRPSWLPFALRCDVPGAVQEIEPDQFERLADQNPTLRDKCARYQCVLQLLLAQAAVCARFHSSQQRLAKWLSLLADRVHPPTFPATHEGLALVLGNPRPAVSTVAGMLRAKGLITYSRGQIRVQDQRALRTLACECYELISQYLALLNDSPRTS